MLTASLGSLGDGQPPPHSDMAGLAVPVPCWVSLVPQRATALPLVLLLDCHTHMKQHRLLDIARI